LQTQFRLAPGDTTLRYTLAPEVVAEYGTIRVLALLDGRVYIDGNSMGSIASGEAREYEQPVGPHKVEVRSAGETVTQNVTVAKGKTVAVTLRPPSPPPITTRLTPRLRSEPRSNLSEADAKAMILAKGFFDSDWNKNVNGWENQYELRTIAGDEVVVDKSTGLMWQKSGSLNYMIYAEAQKWIDNLNAEGFANARDWRLPTLEEAMSLMESRKLNGDLYIDPKFDSKQRWIWTADKESAGVAWVATFGHGGCDGYGVQGNLYVRAVRFGQ
jgi:hypothetical protein